MGKRRIILIIGLLLGFQIVTSAQSEVPAHNWSFRHNLIYDATGTFLNAGAEYNLNDYWSLGMNAGLKSWPRFWPWDLDNTTNTSHMRHFLLAPEVRYYLGGTPFAGHFVGGDLIYTHYNVGNYSFPFGLYPALKTERWQGDFAGVGAFYGYAWRFARHWSLEAEAGIGIGWAGYKRFKCEHCGTQIGGYNNKLGVIPKLGLNIAYNTGKVQPSQMEEPVAPLAPGVPEEPKQPEVVCAPEPFEPEEPVKPTTVGDQLSEHIPWVLPLSEYRPVQELPFPGKDSMLYVHFELNRHRLLLNFPTNPEELRAYPSNGVVLDSIVRLTKKLNASPHNKMHLIQIVGLASIDGPYKQNVTLSENRAKALKDFVQEVTGLGDERFEYCGKGEAWDWFRDQMERLRGRGGNGLSAQDVDNLLTMMDSVPDPDRREWIIKSDRRLYSTLRDSILADQRNSGYIRIYFTRSQEVQAEVDSTGIKAVNARNEAARARWQEQQTAYENYLEQQRAYEAALKQYEEDMKRYEAAKSAYEEQYKEYLQEMERYRKWRRDNHK